MITRNDAILKLVSGNLSFKADGTVNYIDNQTPPTEEAIQVKLSELKADYDSKSYARARQKEYPNLQECIHALLDGGDTLTELQTKRSEIKQKYPKPT